jgi:hypothetical protein
VAVLFALGLGFIVYQLVRAMSGTIRIVAIVFFLFLLAVLLLPALAPAKSRASASADSTERSVSILDRQLVGVFETTTIASRDPKALQIWLRANGFVMSTNSEPIIESYVKDGWVLWPPKCAVRRPTLNPVRHILFRLLLRRTSQFTRCN